MRSHNTSLPLQRFNLGKQHKTRARNESCVIKSEIVEKLGQQRHKRTKTDTLSYEIKLLNRPECHSLAEKAIKKNGVNYREFYPNKFDLYRVDEFERKRVHDADALEKA